jgi:hypothetical protein
MVLILPCIFESHINIATFQYLVSFDHRPLTIDKPPPLSEGIRNDNELKYHFFNWYYQNSFSSQGF